MSPSYLLIDKPAGLTSHDVVNRVRRATGVRRVGHAGTLDPFATGLLIVGVGREATREFQKFVGLDKTYEATFVLGASSDTDDVTGTIQPQGYRRGTAGVEKDIQKVLAQFTGEIEQVPPAYSAVKISGKKMYEAAREGKPLEAKPRKVTIYSIELQKSPSLNDSTTQSLPLTIHCSSGTYIRALARDLGRALGTGGYVESLRRTAIGPFSIHEATTLENLSPIPLETMLSRL